MESPEFSFIPTTEQDRTYIARLNFLTDVHGHEDREVTEWFDADFITYVEHWQPENGGVIAWSNNIPAGGAWLLWGTDKQHGYGHVEVGIPEVAVAVETAFRGHGLGRLLLDEAAKVAKAAGAPGISLCVDTDNTHAKKVYLDLGYETLQAAEPHECYERMLLRFDV